MTNLPHPLPTADQLLRFAPHVSFSQYEKYFPCTIDFLCQHATIRDTNNPNWGVQATPTAMAQYSANNYYLQIDPNCYTGMAPVNGKVNVPMIVAVQYYDNLFIDINYIFLYPYQGPQTLVIAEIGFRPSIFFCTAATLAEHQADVERIVVRVLPDWQTVAGVGFDAHGHTRFYTIQEISWCPDQPNAPIVIAAMNGHASYNPRVSPQPWVTESFQYILAVGSYIDGQGASWQPSTASDIILVGLYEGQPINDQTWVSFSGKLGKTQQNSFVSAANLDGSPLSASRVAYCNTLSWGAQTLNLLSKKLLTGDPPDGLASRKYTEFAPPVPYMQIFCDANHNFVLSADPQNSTGGIVVMPQDASDDHQLWYVDHWSPDGFVLWNKASGLVVSPGGSNAQLVQLNVPYGNCVWNLQGDEGNGYYSLTPTGSPGWVIDVKGGSPYARCAVQLDSGANAASQRWGFGLAQGFYHQILVRQNSSLALSVNVDDPQGPLVLRDADPTKSEQLWLRGTTGVNFTLQNKHSKLYARANGSDTLVTQSATADGQCQWNLGSDEGDDFHALRPVYDTNQNLDVRGGNSTDGSQIDTYGWKKQPWQEWQLLPVELARS